MIDDGALRVEPAGARVLADRVDAGVVLVAVVVPLAPGRERGQQGAAAVVVHDVAVGARAEARLHRLGLNNSADG